MKTKMVSVLVGVLLCMPCFASTSTIEFVGYVQRDSNPGTQFTIRVPAGQDSKVTLNDGTTVEIKTADGEKPETVIHLISPTGAQLHTETVPGADLASKSFEYLICGKGITFISPAPEAPAKCPAAG